MSALTWIRKNIFRIYRGGKHRTDGLSTYERTAFTTEPDRDRERAIKSPYMSLPVVPGYAAPASEVARATEISMAADQVLAVKERQDYVPTHADVDETRIMPEDWTSVRDV